MIICVKSNDKCYGMVGKPTDMKDDLGNTLSVGDIVLVTHKHANWQRVAFVCQYENQGDFYIPCVPRVQVIIIKNIRKERIGKEQFSIEKIIDYSKLKCGMSIGDFVLKRD